MRDKLERLAALPRLPGHRSNPHCDVKVSGITVRIHKAKSSRSIPVSARLMSLLGDELYQLVTHSDGEDSKAGALVALLEVDFENESQAKNAMIGIVLPMLYKRVNELTEDSGPGSMFWYFEQILAGNLEYDGVRFETMDEIDEIGLGVASLTRLFWAGLSLALFPTQGGPDIATGDRGPESPEKSQARETPSISGASARMTTPRAQTSTTAG